MKWNGAVSLEMELLLVEGHTEINWKTKETSFIKKE